MEDDQDDQDLFVAALTGINYATLFAIASNGKEAIEKLRGSMSLPAVIVMDINMPVMNGIECLSEMAKDPLINVIPVVMPSSDVRLQKKAEQLGAIGFIKKQNSSLVLRDSLEQMLAEL